MITSSMYILVLYCTCWWYTSVCLPQPYLRLLLPLLLSLLLLCVEDYDHAMFPYSLLYLFYLD